MRFLPPIRITAPLLALTVGLAATFFEYRLNLDLDLARHLAEVRQRANSTGHRLAALSKYLLPRGESDALQADLKGITQLPQLEIAAVVDDKGRIIADSTGSLTGQLAAATSLAKAAALITPGREASVQHGEDEQTVVSAHPFRLSNDATSWVLLKLDRAAAIADTKADARTQLAWMASAMALLSFALWAVLHFAFAARLGRLADSMRAFGEGKTDASVLPAGDDEVGEVSAAFTAMAARLRARETEQMRLEREVLEISEGERRRIGHDLHDGLGQQLTAASMTTNALVGVLKTAAPALTEHGEEIGRQLREAIAEARSLSHGLAPVALVDEGLMGALGLLAEGTNHGGTVRCVFECVQTVRVSDAEMAGHLYRIAQEAVTNAVKHAASSEIRIGLEQGDGWLVLEIDDDGEGFAESTTPNDGIGLRVMRYRARLIGGVLEIGSAPAGGARIRCRVKLAA